MVWVRRAPHRQHGAADQQRLHHSLVGNHAGVQLGERGIVVGEVRTLKRQPAADADPVVDLSLKLAVHRRTVPLEDFHSNVQFVARGDEIGELHAASFGQLDRCCERSCR